ncbi:hypothetical protein [Halomarina pelagica]|uniref:hypothetical protein n=1 Tax=Halomarina pelagica TaxID=2961599 RepID=UPI0020C244C2|nr:hypothetical protein [Halomarina sp. BND7]
MSAESDASERIDVSVGDNETLGTIVEATVRERFALADVSADSGVPADALATHDLRVHQNGENPPVLVVREGTPIEVKATREWVSNGGSARTRGRVWINAATHAQLVASAGWYAVAVYEPVVGDDEDDLDVEVLAVRLLPAVLLDDLLDEPTNCGPKHDIEAAYRLAWPHVIDPDQVDDRCDVRRVTVDREVGR